MTNLDGKDRGDDLLHRDQGRHEGLPPGVAAEEELERETVVDADSPSSQTAVGVLDVGVGQLHDVRHVEGAVLGAGLLTELLEIDVASRGHQEDGHLTRGRVDKGDVSDFPTGHEEVIGGTEGVSEELVYLDTVSSHQSQQGLTARQPDGLDDVVPSLQLGLQHQLVRHPASRVEGEDVAVHEAADSQEVLVAGVGDQGEDREGDRGGGEPGQGQLLLGGVRLLQQSGELEDGDLPLLVSHGQVLPPASWRGEATHDASPDHVGVQQLSGLLARLSGEIHLDLKTGDSYFTAHIIILKYDSYVLKGALLTAQCGEDQLVPGLSSFVLRVEESQGSSQPGQSTQGSHGRAGVGLQSRGQTAGQLQQGCQAGAVTEDLQQLPPVAVNQAGQLHTLLGDVLPALAGQVLLPGTDGLLSDCLVQAPSLPLVLVTRWQSGSQGDTGVVLLASAVISLSVIIIIIIIISPHYQHYHHHLHNNNSPVTEEAAVFAVVEVTVVADLGTDRAAADPLHHAAGMAVVPVLGHEHPGSLGVSTELPV